MPKKETNDGMVVPNGSRPFSWEDFRKRRAKKRAHKRLEKADEWRTSPQIEGLKLFTTKTPILNMDLLLKEDTAYLGEEFSPGCFRKAPAKYYETSLGDGD